MRQFEVVGPVSSFCQGSGCRTRHPGMGGLHKPAEGGFGNSDNHFPGVLHTQSEGDGK